MVLGDGDYLGWYNSEIDRYRDTEWKVSGYAGAFSLAIIYLATDTNRNAQLLKHPYLTSLALLGFASFLLWSEAHIHKRLNDFRAQRSALENGETDHRKKAGNLVNWKNRTDLAYYFAFQFFIGGTAAVAIFFIAPKIFRVGVTFFSVVFFVSSWRRRN